MGAGAKITDLFREYQISTAALYNWEKEKVTSEDDALRELKQHKQENARAA